MIEIETLSWYNGLEVGIMSYLPFPSRYDRFPQTVVSGTEGMSYRGYPAIVNALRGLEIGRAHV